jgi:ligand-binding SRPBCC domain-containing protein
MKRWRYSTSQVLAVPVDRVWQEAIKVAHLDQLTPPWLRFEVACEDTDNLVPGRLLDYRMTWRGMPLHWTTEVLAVDPPHHFAYRQHRGPYRNFEHHHHFAVVEGGTLVEETIDLAVWGAGLAWALFVRPDLNRLYRFRHAALRARLEAP